MNLTQTACPARAHVPRPVLILVAVHLAAVAFIGAAAAWAGAGARTASFDAWVFSRPAVVNAPARVTAPAASAPADAAIPAWLQQSDRRDSQRPWTESPDGRVRITR